MHAATHRTARSVIALLGLAVAALASPRLYAQSFGIATSAGDWLVGTPLSLSGTGEARVLRVRVGTTERSLPWSSVLGIHGPSRALAVPGPVVLDLVAGDVLAGELRGGDRAGENLVLRSLSLGEVEVPVDRLELLRFTARVRDDEVPRLRLQQGAKFSEAIFLRARRGFDSRLGEIHAFGTDALEFAVGAADEPQRWLYSELAAVAASGGEKPPRPGDALLVTRAQDRLHVELLALADGQLRIRLETGAELAVSLAELAALQPTHDGIRHLSDLPTEELVERAYFAETDVPLLAMRRDRAVTGSLLRAHGHVFGKGLGVHSRSAASWRVPDGVAALTGFVALDESVRELAVRGHAAVRVSLDGKALVTHDALAAGSGLQPLGRLPVRAGQLLRLEVDYGDGLDLGDRVDWLGVAFVR